MPVKVALIVLYAGWCAYQSQAYVQTFHSNDTLWAQARAASPLKPRPAFNYGSTLIAAGKVTEGLKQYAIAQQLARQPYIPETDRRITLEGVEHNVTALVEARRRDKPPDCSHYMGSTGLPFCGDAQ